MTRALLIFFVALPWATRGQTSDEERVKASIDRLFSGMKNGDSALVHSAFAKEVTMATIYKDKNNLPVIKNELGVADFLKAVGTPHNEVWNEPIWDLKIKIDGNLAQAFASYAFYRGNTFSHCGVDAFHLFKAADGQWQIFHLADTRQKEGCVVPEKIKNQFK